MRILIALFTLLIVSASFANAQTVSMPPDGAVILGPFTVGGTNAKIEDLPQPDIGSAALLADSTQLVYQAPDTVEEVTEVVVAYKLEGETNLRSTTIAIDPTYSAQGGGAVGMALVWLTLLLVLALFIEGAVLVVVSLVRVVIRGFRGKAALEKNDGLKPSVYKPAFALVLSGLAVVGFGLDPLNDIFDAFGNEPAYKLGGEIGNAADLLITVLLVAGGAESVRHVAFGITRGIVPTAKELDDAAEEADTRS